MSAPVTSPSSSSAASAISGGAGAKAVSLNPLGSPLFSSLLSMGLSNFTMSPTTSAEGQEIATSAAANTDAKSGALANNTFGLQQALLISPDELNAMSDEDLKSLLASFGDTSDELTPQILVALAPGVPAKDAFENIKAKFSELGIDTSKFVSVAIATPTDAPVAAPTVTGDAALTVDTTDAAQATNFLLITTGFTPSEMGALKDAIKAVTTSTAGEPVEAADAPETVVSEDADDANATAAAMVMVVFVVPLPKPAEAPASAQEISFDLSALSAFTQAPVGTDEEPDWTKKLSDKLSTMSLDGDISPFDTDASPFDDEMNAILSASIAASASKSADAGFQGSIATTTDTSAKDADKAKTMAGEISAQALLALNHGGALTSAALHNLNGDALLYANGNMLSAQNMSSLSNPIFTSASAIGAHPAVLAVATLIEKAASGSEKAKQELSVQLDPPELGRMQVQLSMEKDGVMKVHLLAEKQETLSLLQRDSHALKSALDSAGIQVDSGSLTFDLASGGDQSFNQLMGGSQQDSQSSGNQSRFVITADGNSHDASSMSILDTKMDFIPDKVTGNIHYSLWA